MPGTHWIVKQEPSDFGWADLLREGQTAWTGVRNFQARNYLRAMRRGDRVGFYHSGPAREVVGIARVTREAYPDPTAATGEDWICVDLAPIQTLKCPVGLATIKADPVLRSLALVRQSRLSVMPVSNAQFSRLLELARAPAKA